MEINLLFAIILMSTLYILLPILLAILYRYKKTNKIIASILLVLFIVVLFFGVFTKFAINKQTIKITFDYNHPWASESILFNSTVSPFDFGVNIVMLIPIGVFFTLMQSYKQNFSIKKNLLASLLLGIILGFSIELLQFILPIQRSIQVSDVLLNAVSCFLGSLYFVILLALRKKLFHK